MLLPVVSGPASRNERPDADATLDVRAIDGEPFEDIMDALGADETLLLINSFEPVPLYDVLTARGFEYETANPEPELSEIEHARAESCRSHRQSSTIVEATIFDCRTTTGW